MEGSIVPPYGRMKLQWYTGTPNSSGQLMSHFHQCMADVFIYQMRGDQTIPIKSVRIKAYLFMNSRYKVDIGFYPNKCRCWNNQDPEEHKQCKKSCHRINYAEFILGGDIHDNRRRRFV